MKISESKVNKITKTLEERMFFCSFHITAELNAVEFWKRHT